jgi:hypothetical protein
MSFIVRQKVGSHTYLYEAVSYRNEDGKPRGKRVPVGKLDAAGQPVYKDEYINRMAQAGTPVSVIKNTAYTIGDIAGSHIKELGSFYLLKEIARTIGLLEILQEVFPDRWRELFDFACFLVSNGGTVYVLPGLAFKNRCLLRQPFKCGYYPAAFFPGPPRTGTVFYPLGRIPH